MRKKATSLNKISERLATVLCLFTLMTQPTLGHAVSYKKSIALAIGAVAGGAASYGASSASARSLADFANNELKKMQSYRPNDEFAFDCTRGAIADSQALNQIDRAQSAFMEINVKKVFDANDNHQYLILISTDGTSKDASTILGKSDPSLVHYLKGLSKTRSECLKLEKENTAKRAEDASANLYKQWSPKQFPSNPALLAWLTSRSGNNHVKVIYVHGVGADHQVTVGKNATIAATGDTLSNQIEDAYAKVKRQVIAVFERDKSPRIVFVTTGFSRGAAAARVLNNRIVQQGFMQDAHYLIRPGEANIGASVLFDTVITQRIDVLGNLGIHSEQGDLSASKSIDADEYTFPESLTQALHIVAANEYRKGFELKHASGINVKEITLPGAHSDIGGGYGFGGISAISLKMAMNYLSKAGVPMCSLPDEFRSNEFYVIHDSRKFPTMPFEQQLLQKRTSSDR